MHRWLLSLLGPVFAKEMVEMARRKRYFFNRALYGLVLLVVLWIIWDGYRWRLARGSAETIRAYAQLAADLFIAVSIIQFAAVFLFVPLFIAGVIAGEREEKTLDLLLTTRLEDRDIVLGKLFSRLVVFLLLLLSGLPVLSLVMLMGGIDPVALGRVTLATLGAMFFTAAHAIWFSTITKSPTGALVRTYWWLAVWLIGLPIIVLQSLEAFPTAVRVQLSLYVLGGFSLVNPIGPFIAALLPPRDYDRIVTALANFVGDELASWFFALTFVLPLLWSLFLLWRTVGRLRREPLPMARWLRWKLLDLFRKRLPDGKSDERAGGRDVLALIPFPLGNYVPWRMNPLWQRSCRARVYDRDGYIGRVQWAGWGLAFVFINLLAIAGPRALADDDGAIAMLAPTWIALAALTAIFAGSSLVADRRRGFLEQVLVTPLSAGEIVDGTLLAVWQHLRRGCFLVAALAVLFCLTHASHPGGAICSFVTGVLACTLVAVHGVLCSAAARTLAGSLVLTFLFPLVVTIGTVMLVVLTREAAGPALLLTSFLVLGVGWVWKWRRPNAASMSCFFSGVHLTLVCVFTAPVWMSASSREVPAIVINPGFWIVYLLSHRWPGPQVAAGTTWYGALVLYLAAIVVNLLWARWWLGRNLDRLVGRVSKASARKPIPARAGRQSIILAAEGAGVSRVVLTDDEGKQETR